MGTVILRYASPLAAFGHTGRYDNRPSASTPTVSAVQGMVAAAAGLTRGEIWPDWIAQMHLAIRVDTAGEMHSDYQTVNQPALRRYRWLPAKDRKKVMVLATAEGGRPSTSTVISRRDHITDATFLLAVDDPAGKVAEVLAAPRFALYAGRKSCPLTEPFFLGTVTEHCGEAVSTVPTVPTSDETDAETVTRDVILFTDPGGGNVPVEDRNDRATKNSAWRPQRRWHTTVTVPTAQTWFEVAAHLQGAFR